MDEYDKIEAETHKAYKKIIIEDYSPMVILDIGLNLIAKVFRNELLGRLDELENKEDQLIHEHLIEAFVEKLQEVLNVNSDLIILRDKEAVDRFKNESPSKGDELDERLSNVKKYMNIIY